MKPLFDQNLSHQLCRMLADLYADGAQVRALGLDRASDEAIWAFAREQGFTIVTLDADFADMAALRGAPPKVIWLRCGNQPTSAVEKILRDRAELIESFGNDDEAACLELY